MIKIAFRSFTELFHRPAQVLLLCGGLALVAIALDGSLFRLWLLKQEESRLNREIRGATQQISDMRAQIAQAKDPRQIERNARDRFDLAEEDDLIFVFSKEDE